MSLVSVIVALYHPDYKKLSNTLHSILNQKEVALEIILADDGSKDPNMKEWIESFFITNNYEKYIVVQHQYNQGTIKNVVSAINKCRGKYVYLTSPGDLLFDDYVLTDFLKKGEESECSIIFGDAVSYSYDGESIHFYPEWRRPKKPQIYNGQNDKLALTAYLFGNQILGAACFLKREIALKYFRESENCAKYMEDTVGYTLALINGEKIRYYKRNMIWYENGSGVSTSNDSKWDAVLSEEKLSMFKYIQMNYPKNRAVEAALHKKQCRNRYADYIHRCIFHPLISLQIIYIHILPITKCSLTEGDKQRLQNLVCTV